MAPCDRPHATYYQSAIVTIVLSCIVSEIKRDISRKWRFSYPMHSTPPLRESMSEYYDTVWCRKTIMAWLPDSDKKFNDRFSRFDRIPACDGRTDGRTNGVRHFVLVAIFSMAFCPSGILS